MGCISSKTVQCSRCYRSGNKNNLLLNSNNICERCRRGEISEFNRRLAALRDESTATGIVRPSIRPLVGPRSSGSSIQISQVAAVPRRSVQPPQIANNQSKTTTRAKVPSCPASVKYLFGEYKCPECKNSWTSRRSWRDMYQKCRKCGKHVYPHLQRELRKSDMTTSEKSHPEELCEKCIRLGHYCGNRPFGKTIANRRT